MDYKEIFRSSKLEWLKGVYCVFIIPYIKLSFAVRRRLELFGILKSDPRFNSTKKYKNRHKGKRVFIIATGPSLTIADIEKLSGEYTISMNSIVNVFSRTDFRPTYYMISDNVGYRILPHAQTLMPPERVFVGIGNVNTKWNINLKDVKQPEDQNINLFHVDRTRTLRNLYIHKDKFNTQFSDDAEKGFIDGGTITYLAIQMAVYMGFTEIYLLGADGNYLQGKLHFDEKEDELEKIEENTAYLYAYRFKVAYECARAYLDDKDVRIYNATRGGFLEIFPRVSLDELFE